MGFIIPIDFPTDKIIFDLLTIKITAGTHTYKKIHTCSFTVQEETQAIMFRKSELKYSFSVVFIFKFADNEKSKLVKYITKRQMAIIREFKGMQNG